MAIVVLKSSIAPSNGAQDNKLVSPDGGDVYLQLNRGYNCVVSSYRIDICRVISAEKLEILTKVGAGKYPADENPNAPAPLFNLGAPATLAGKCITLLSDAVSASGQVGQVDVIVGIYQFDGATFRRVDWEADSAHAVQLQSRFEILLS
jgi:hypothetical protein